MQAVNYQPARSARRQWQGLSMPIKRVIEMGALYPSLTVFDFGCGHGLDMQYLRHMGYEVNGWDPYWYPQGQWVESDVVLLNYVLDCIADPHERTEALARAWGLTKRMLMVSVRRDRGLKVLSPFSDGYLTQWGTFQKLFRQDELREYLETYCGSLALPFDRGGCFVVYRDCSRWCSAPSRGR